MPVYEFLCRDCGQRYEDLVGMDASLDDQACTTCTSADVVKLFSPFRATVSSGGTTIQLDGSVPAGRGARAGGCCGGGCGGCG